VGELGSESGWGMNITDQADLLFVTWFTYDAQGKGLWLVASHVSRNSDGTFSGTLYRTTGPAYNAAQWDPAQVRAQAVGSITFTFTDSSHASFTATVDGSHGLEGHRPRGVRQPAERLRVIPEPFFPL
jgi:hypothetical protein